MKSDINDFGTNVSSLNKRKPRSPESVSSRPNALDEEKEDILNSISLTQWAICGPNTYKPVSTTIESLKTGVYSITLNQFHGLIYIKKNICIDLVYQICNKFNLKLLCKVSKRSAGEKYIGNDSDWHLSESILESICYKKFDNNFSIDIGGASFYGPKIDFIAKDKLEREWQLGTVQLDFNLSKRFDIFYTNSENKKETPILIHRALLGSLERFIGILLENDLIPLSLQPFNMGVIWIGNNEIYLEKCISEFKNLSVYPTIIKSHSNLKESMSNLYNKDITQITIIGKKEETNQTLNYNKIDYSYLSYFDTIKKLYCL